MSAPVNYLKLTQFRFDDSTPKKDFEVKIKELKKQQTFWGSTETRQKVIEQLEEAKTKQEFNLKMGFFSEKEYIEWYKREARIKEFENAQCHQGYCELRQKKIEIYKAKHEEANHKAWLTEMKKREAKKNIQQFILSDSTKNDQSKKVGLISRVRLKLDSMLK